MSTNLVHIGEVLVNGVVFDPKNSEALRSMDLENLLQAAPRLFDLLEKRGVDYVLVGGIAMLVYVEGRNTQVVDLIISAADLAKLPDVEINDQNQEFLSGKYGELSIDFLFTENELFAKVKDQHSVKQRFVEREIRCATVEGLLLLKLFALPSLYRQGKFARVRIYENDVASLIETYQPDLEPILEELASHLLDSDRRELQKLVQEIEDRIRRSQQRFRNHEDESA